MAGKAEYKNPWQKENCNRVNLTLPKGRKAELQAYAAAAGESLNGFKGRAITETMERDGAGGPQEWQRIPRYSLTRWRQRRGHRGDRDGILAAGCEYTGIAGQIILGAEYQSSNGGETELEVLRNDRQNRGVYRSVPVTIPGALHTPPQSYLVPVQMEQLLADYEDMINRLRIVEAVAEFHLRFGGVHPFIDEL